MTKEKSTKVTRAKKEKTSTKEKRAATPYNSFMKSELAKVKKSNPSMNHKDAFKVAAQNWASSSENPKNKK